VTIRPTTAGQIDLLNIGELYLYAADGSPITPLAATQSTTFGAAYVATNVIDNNTATFSHTANGDPSPRLTVLYSCPGGKTSAAKVVVHNRPDCCQSRLNVFSLDFVNASGQADPLVAYKFVHAGASDTVWGEREWPELCIAPTACSLRVHSFHHQ
jgi:hypothetical protein